MDSNTTMFNVDDIADMRCEEILSSVYYALEERGYNPINQIVGYLMSGDPGYISSHKEARSKICSIERDKIIAYLLKKELEK